MRDKKLKINLSDKELRMHAKIILCVLKSAMELCDTYEEFKCFINQLFEDAANNEK